MLSDTYSYNLSLSDVTLIVSVAPKDYIAAGWGMLTQGQGLGIQEFPFKSHSQAIRCRIGSVARQQEIVKLWQPGSETEQSMLNDVSKQQPINPAS